VFFTTGGGAFWKCHGTHSDTASHYSTLQHAETRCSVCGYIIRALRYWWRRISIHCNTLQYISTRCNTLQHAATRCNTLQNTATCRRMSGVSQYIFQLHCNTATHCNTLQCTATQYRAFSGVCVCSFFCLFCMIFFLCSLCAYIYRILYYWWWCILRESQCNCYTATHCNTMQHTAAHCNTLQRFLTHCYTLQYISTRCNTLQHAATHCNMSAHVGGVTVQFSTPLQHCNTLQHTAMHCNTIQGF